MSMSEVLKKSGTHESKKREHGLEGHWLDKINSFSFVAIERMREMSKSEGKYIWESEKQHMQFFNLGYV